MTSIVARVYAPTETAATPSQRTTSPPDHAGRVALLTFVLLARASVVLSGNAVILKTLSLGASYGSLVRFSKQGQGSKLIDGAPCPALASTIGAGTGGRPRRWHGCCGSSLSATPPAPRDAPSETSGLA